MANCFDCQRPECVALWKTRTVQFGRPKSVDESNLEEKKYMDGEIYHIQHCQNSGCHEIYIRGKNGVDCDGCGVRYCELCQCSVAKETEDGEYLCSDCAEHYDGEFIK